jgi:prepilin-type N-terminal cleavage/methylation domain-containing protein
MLNNKGFTIFEVMTVALIVGIVTAISFPAATRSLKKYNFSNDARNIMAIINQARLASMQKCVTTSVQFNGNQILAFIDDGGGVAGNAGNGIRDAGERLVADGRLSTGISCVTLFQDKLNGGKSMSFNRLGLPWGINGVGQPLYYSGTITLNMLADNSTTLTKIINISSGGRLWITTPSN